MICAHNDRCCFLHLAELQIVLLRERRHRSAHSETAQENKLQREWVERWGFFKAPQRRFRSEMRKEKLAKSASAPVLAAAGQEALAWRERRLIYRDDNDDRD